MELDESLSGLRSDLLPELQSDYRGVQMLEVLAEEPSGLTSNEWSRRCRNILSKGTFSKRAKQFVEAGLVSGERVGKQKILYKYCDLERVLGQTLSNLRVLEESFEDCVQFALACNEGTSPRYQMEILERLRRLTNRGLNQSAEFFESCLRPGAKASNFVGSEAFKLQLYAKEYLREVVGKHDQLRELQGEPFQVRFTRGD